MSDSSFNEPVASATKAWDEIREQLSTRARRARWMSYWLLGLIILVLVAGGIGIGFSNKIVEYGWSYSSPGLSWDNEYTTYEYTPTSSGPNKSPNALPNDIAKKLQDSIDVLGDKLAIANDTIAEVKKSQDALKEGMSNLKETVHGLEFARKERSASLEFLITTFATRFGIAVAAILLVRILTSIYRYNIRLGNR